MTKTYSYKCPGCGEVYASLDRQYVADWPNSADTALGQLLEEHENRDCPEIPDDEIRD